MRADRHPEHLAVILVPDSSDRPEDLEDVIHDVIQKDASGDQRTTCVVLDLSGLKDPGPWMKAAGPEVPNVNLRVALGEKGFLMARVLKLDAFFDWYPDVEAALRADA